MEARSFLLLQRVVQCPLASTCDECVSAAPYARAHRQHIHSRSWRVWRAFVTLAFAGDKKQDIQPFVYPATARRPLGAVGVGRLSSLSLSTEQDVFHILIHLPLLSLL